MKQNLWLKKQENIFVVTAPSGTGKTTINRKLVEDILDLKMSVSHTTRQRRDKEKDGDHYWFVTKSKFNKLIKEGSMLEWAQVYDNFYGTSYSELDRIISGGYKALLEVDVQGWHNLKSLLPAAKSILILPPSMEELWRRLASRGTNTSNEVALRIQTSIEELSFAKDFDFFIVNDNLDATYNKLCDFINNKSSLDLSKEAGISHSQTLIKQFPKVKAKLLK